MGVGRPVVNGLNTGGLLRPPDETRHKKHRQNKCDEKGKSCTDSDILKKIDIEKFVKPIEHR
jgi:hypothetical protein